MGFDIHDRTEDDVRQVCAYILQAQAPNAQDAREIIRLIEKIFQRARGVFLWVKLVMPDLCRHVADCIDRGMGSLELQKQLLNSMEALPTNLIDYYMAIIDRISPALRWETYCLLKCICRSNESTHLDELSSMLACGSFNSFKRL